MPIEVAKLDRIQPRPTTRPPPRASQRGPTRSSIRPPKNIVTANENRNVMKGRLPWNAVTQNTFSTAGLKML
jgi:hypothetical protein